MTDEEISNISAGKELDALIAEKVFDNRGVTTAMFGNMNAVKPYSTDIATAWEIVEKLNMAVLTPKCFYAGGEYQNIDQYTAESGGWFESAETAPLAICRVALLVTNHG